MVLPEALYENRQILNRISICSSKDKVLSFPQRKCFNILSLPPSLWLVTLGNGTPPGDHYLSLLFAYLILSSRCDQLRLAEWQFILLSTCIIPISATLFMGPLSNDRNDWAKRPTVYRMGHPVYLITGLLLWWCYPLMSIYKNTSIFIFIAHLGRSMYILFLWCLSHQFSNNVLSKSLVIQASSLQSINQWGKKQHRSRHFCFHKKCIIMCSALNSAHHEDLPLLVSFRIVPEKGSNDTTLRFWVLSVECAESSVN